VIPDDKVWKAHSSLQWRGKRLSVEVPPEENQQKDIACEILN